MKKKYWILIFSVILCLLVLTLKGLKRYKAESSLSQYPSGGDFTLTTATGELFDLKKQRGKVVILYFGYTFCPDVCPTTLATISSALGQLSTENLAQVTTLFIGVDSKRDTKEKLKEYTAFFHPSILGLTGSDEELRDVASKYSVNFVINEPEAGKDYYTVDHSTQFFVIDQKGQVADLVPHGESALKIKEIILNLLKENK